MAVDYNPHVLDLSTERASGAGEVIDVRDSHFELLHTDSDIWLRLGDATAPRVPVRAGQTGTPEMCAGRTFSRIYVENEAGKGTAAILTGEVRAGFRSGGGESVPGPLALGLYRAGPNVGDIRSQIAPDHVLTGHNGGLNGSTAGVVAVGDDPEGIGELGPYYYLEEAGPTGTYFGVDLRAESHRLPVSILGDGPAYPATRNAGPWSVSDTVMVSINGVAGADFYLGFGVVGWESGVGGIRVYGLRWWFHNNHALAGDWRWRVNAIQDDGTAGGTVAGDGATIDGTDVRVPARLGVRWGITSGARWVEWVYNGAVVHRQTGPIGGPGVVFDAGDAAPGLAIAGANSKTAQVGRIYGGLGRGLLIEEGGAA